MMSINSPMNLPVNLTASGQVLTVTGGGNPSWVAATNPPNGALTVTGKATFKNGVEIDGDLTIGGVAIGDRLGKIEERLGILRPNERLESKWEELQELGKQYRELERYLLEQEEIIRILKS